MVKRIILLFYLLLTCACLLQAQNGFSAHRQVTTDHTQVPSTQSNFPVATYNTFTDMKSTGNGGLVTSTSGFDIIPTSDVGCVTALPFDLDYFAPTTGQFVLHVQIASLSSSANNTYYICYGKSSITTNQSSLATVWSGYSAVNHMNKTGGSSWVDSSPQVNTMGDIFTGLTDTAGELGRGGLGVGTGGINDSTPTGLPTGNGARSMSAWFKMSSTASNGTIIGFGTQNTGQRFMLYFNPNGGTPLVSNDIGTTGWGVGCCNDTTTWHQAVWTLPASGNFNQGLLYIDGVQLISGQPSATVNTVIGVLDASQLTGNGAASFNLSGSLDELRVKNSVETADWITTEYNNQKPSSTFLTFGAAASAGYMMPFVADIQMKRIW